MRNLAFLFGAVALVVPVTAFADDTPIEPSAKDAAHATHAGHRSQVLDMSAGGGLAHVGDRSARAQALAGVASHVSLASREIKATRPAGGHRTMARMNVARVMAELDASLQQCTAVAASPASVLSVRLSVTPAGTIERADLAGGGQTLRTEVLDCVVSVVTTAQFRALGGAGASITVSIALAARTKASVAAQAVAVQPLADTQPTAVAVATTK